MSRNIFIALIGGMAVISLAAAQPDTLWTRTFGGSDWDVGYSVQQTSDGGYIIAGGTNSYGTAEADVYLVKTDSSGIEQWSQTFGGSDLEYGESVQQTRDGGYIIAGRTNSYGAGSWDVYLIQTDASGNQRWIRTIGGSDADLAWSVQQTRDDGYIIVGWTCSYGAGENDVYLIKTDASGIEQWSQTFGGSYNDYGRSVQQTGDGGYIIAGHTGGDVYLIKTDSSGIEQWSQTFGGSNFDEGRSVQQTRDGGYIIAGTTSSFGAGYYDVYLIKTDASGMEQWSQTFGGSYNDEGRSVQQTSDGGYIIAGSTRLFGSPYSHDVYLIKADASGTERWSQILGGSSDDEGNSVQQTRDGGYIIAGWTNSYGPNWYDVWLIRLEAETVMLTLSPLNPPILILPGGGSFSFDLDIYNGTTTNYVVNVKTDVTLPGGTTYQLLSREGINLASGASLLGNLTQFVPGGAHAGNYAYNGYVYDHTTGDLLAEDSFPFEKLAGDDSPIHNLGWVLFGWDGEETSAGIAPKAYALCANHPNPFNPTTTLRFALPEAARVKLSIYDVSGRLVTTLVDGWREAGLHEVIFDGSNMASGIYICRLETGSHNTVRKLVLLK